MQNAGPICDQGAGRTREYEPSCVPSLCAPDEHVPQRTRATGAARRQRESRADTLALSQATRQAPVSIPTPGRRMHTEAKRISIDLSPKTVSSTTGPSLASEDGRRPPTSQPCGSYGEKKSPEEEKTTRGQRAWHRVGMSVRVLNALRHPGHIFPHLTSHRNIQKESAPRHSTFTPESSAAKSLAGGTTHLQRQPQGKPMREEDYHQ